jgi:hypothetical protein
MTAKGLGNREIQSLLDASVVVQKSIANSIVLKLVNRRRLLHGTVTSIY